ncbi:helix-turn-helix domain-containing protein [Dactylosporangium sp. CS-047395]|uniref:helix-turn-helix domain-containing protein n=1 Tax=Dactylosporangium sp. CS-047395 TaxID=3239936 RepID=UPI003D8F7C78
MALTLSTAAFAPKDRFEVLRTAVWSSLVRVELGFDPEPPVDADLSIHQLGPLSVCTAVSNCTEIRRTARLIRDDAEPAVFLGLQRAGTSGIVQAGKETVLHPGDLAVYDSTNPYVLVNHVGVNHHYFRIPKRELALPDSVIAELVALQLDRANPVTRLLSVYLQGLVAELAGGPPPGVATPTIELIRAAVAAHFPGEALVREPLHETLHHRIMAWCEAHLAEADLTPARIAAAHHISVRQLYTVLGRNGIVLGDWIRARRLEQCRRELATAAPGVTVAAIAHRWGFASAAHFSRVFRAAYGQSPRAWRERGRG